MKNCNKSNKKITILLAVLFFGISGNAFARTVKTAYTAPIAVPTGGTTIAEIPAPPPAPTTTPTSGGSSTTSLTTFETVAASTTTVFEEKKAADSLNTVCDKTATGSCIDLVNNELKSPN